jgi:NAD(P)-dependent dehydrogenase (short-subunit alcohol dehydrogenase family)
LGGVNAIARGIMATGMTRELGNKEALQPVASSGPLENLFDRVSKPEEIASAIAFLYLQGSRQIRGQTIHTSTEGSD